MRPTSKERGERVAKEFLGTTHEARAHLAALVKRELDQAAADALDLVRKLADGVDPRMGGSRELFAAAKNFLAAHGVR